MGIVCFTRRKRKERNPAPGQERERYARWANESDASFRRHRTAWCHRSKLLKIYVVADRSDAYFREGSFMIQDLRMLSDPKRLRSASFSATLVEGFLGPEVFAALL